MINDSVKVSGPDQTHMTQMDADIVYYVTTFISKSVKKEVTCVTCDDIFGENSALQINIEGMIPKNCQFFADEISRGCHVKPSYLVYAMRTLAWGSYLQIMENYEIKSFFLSSKMHQSVFLNIVNRQTIENTKYMDILETTCVKNQRFEGLLCNMLSKFLNVMCINLVLEINSNIHTLQNKEEGCKQMLRKITEKISEK